MDSTVCLVEHIMAMDLTPYLMTMDSTPQPCPAWCQECCPAWIDKYNNKEKKQKKVPKVGVLKTTTTKTFLTRLPLRLT